MCTSLRAAVLGLCLIRCDGAPEWRIDAARDALVANGRDSIRLAVRASGFFDRLRGSAPPPLRVLEAPSGVRVARQQPGQYALAVGRTPGRIVLAVGSHQQTLIARPALDDHDRDGLPDVIELWSEDDRAAFTAWFTAIAEAQFHRLDDEWANIHRDCAGLVRYAFREALKPHNESWWTRRAWPPAGAVADVHDLHYPRLPIVGDLPFRARSGPFTPSVPIETQFTAAPSARTLWQHNTDFIGRDVHEARAGDLFFYRPGPNRMHTMIALGPSAGADHRTVATRVVYHTGTTADGPGRVRLVTIGALARHPEPEWRPEPHNPKFLGVHRLRHLTASTERAWAAPTRSM